MRFWLLIVALFVFVNVQGQYDFKPGQVIMHNGDIVFGHLRVHNELQNYIRCNFKSVSGEVIVYSPSDIAGYKFNDGKYYVSKNVNGKQFFLEYLLKGIVSVYFLKDNRWETYFLENEKYGLRALPSEESVKIRAKEGGFIQPLKHLGILNLYMQDDPEIVNVLQSNREVTHTNLVQIAKTYHNNVCSDYNCVVYIKETEDTRRITNSNVVTRKKESITRKVALDIFAGATILKNPVFERDPSAEEYSPPLPSGGLRLNLQTPRINENVYFVLSLYYYNTGDFNRNIRSNHKNRVRINTHIGYRAPDSFKLKPNVSIGLLSPTYSAGLSYPINDNIDLGVLSFACFEPNRLPWIPGDFVGYMVLGNLNYKINFGSTEKFRFLPK